MSDFKAKMHQIRFRLGSAPDPTGGAYNTLLGPIAGFKGPTSKGREGKGREGTTEEGKVKEGTGGEGKGLPFLKS